MKQFFEQEINEIVKKSSLVANGSYDFYKLSEKNPGLLECVIEEQNEEVIFHYDVTDKKSFHDIRTEKQSNIILALLGLMELVALYEEYRFSLCTDNLYYDRNYRVYVKRRDLYDRGVKSDEKQFMDELKAIVGFAIQKKYTFEDYLNGGMTLLQKNRFLKPIYEIETLEEIFSYLKDKYEELILVTKTQKVEVSKIWYQTNKWILISLATILIICFSLGLYVMLEIQPRYHAMLEANNCFMDSNYVGVIDALYDVEMKHLDKYQKTILATAYVKSESLTPEQKEVILEKITVNGEDKIKEYWIYLGRLNTDEAVNIALQRSDDELLLYAYMTQRAMLEKNTEISGEDKKAQLADLETKIEKLAEKYTSEEE